MTFSHPDATSIATAVRGQEIKAKEAVAVALARIAHHNATLNCFTTVLAEQAMAEAEQLDLKIAQGEDPGPLAGVPFGVKDLFDIRGVVTFAGSKINQEHPPATQDATAIARLKQAGAILVGAQTMDEYAYGFTTENSHYGPTHNPHHLDHVAGGSSGGSAAAVAAGLTPFSLGTDTNGSIRVPASLCGIFGLKPTYGRLPRSGAYPFCSSLDHIGPFARSVRDLALLFDCLQGPDVNDPVCTDRPSEPCLPTLEQGIEGLRIGIADDYFTQNALPTAIAAVEQVAIALSTQTHVTIPEAQRARAAAYVITASEGANLHLPNLRSRPQDFDPETRDRLLAGALIPAHWYQQAQRFRTWYRQQVKTLFETVDVILAPTTPCSAPLIGQKTMVLNGQEILVRPNLGLFTQPLSFIGLPIVSVPIHRPNELPLGVQIIGAPFQEQIILRVAHWLEQQGVVSASVPIGF